MVALPNVPGVLAVAVQTKNSDSGYVDINRFHVSYSGTAPTEVQLATFAETVITAWGTALAAFLSSNKVISGISVIDLTSPTAGTVELPGTTVGTLTGAVLPDDAAFVMSIKILRRYRGGHPRLYLPLGDTTSIDSGRTWGAAFVAAVTTAFDGFVAAVEAAGWTGAGTIALVSVSYYQGYHLVTYPSGRHRDVPTLRVAPVVDATSGVIGQARIGSQRRRVAG